MKKCVKLRCAIWGVILLTAVSLLSITVYAHKMNTATETEIQATVHNDEHVDGTDYSSDSIYVDVEHLEQ